MRSRLAIVAIVLLAAGCSSGAANPPRPAAGPPAARPPAAKRKPPAPRPPVPERFERDTVQRLHMHENFNLLRAIERLLIRGKLDEAKRFAAAISEVPNAPAHGPWAAQVVEVRDRAAAVARATSVEQACRLEAKLAAACAGCHLETGIDPVFQSFPAAPADLPTIEARMTRHRWAANRLWEGIVGGAAEPWIAGLDVLAATPLEFGDRSSDRTRWAREAPAPGRPGAHAQARR